MDTVEGLRDATWQARECAVIGHAVTRDHSQDYPVRVAFRGDSHVEYWREEEPEEPEPFGLNKVSRRLAGLSREPA